jgi:hypothetical protein
MIKMSAEIKEGQDLMFLEEIPFEFKKEFLILYELGLEPYEINYLLYLKTKRKVKAKWTRRGD